jgi:hypothetical protein
MNASALEFAPTLAERKAQWRLDNAPLVAKLTAEGIVVCPDCVGRMHADGVCRGCESDPAWNAYCEAVNGAEHAEWDGRPYTYADQKRDEETERRYELAQILGERDAKTPANGCRYCGRLESEHWRWDSRHPLGQDGYVAPPDSLRLLRIKARRDAADARLYRAVARRFEALGGVARAACAECGGPLTDGGAAKGEWYCSRACAEGEVSR